VTETVKTSGNDGQDPTPNTATASTPAKDATTSGQGTADNADPTKTGNKVTPRTTRGSSASGPAKTGAVDPSGSTSTPSGAAAANDHDGGTPAGTTRTGKDGGGE
jgi:hypothetical protein